MTDTHESTEKSELEPCPFCGGKVDLETTIDGRKWWGVVCRNSKNVGGTCGISIRATASKEAAIKRWNTRAPKPVEGRDVTEGDGCLDSADCPDSEGNCNCPPDRTDITRPSPHLKGNPQ